MVLVFCLSVFTVTCWNEDTKLVVNKATDKGELYFGVSVYFLWCTSIMFV